MTQQEAGKLWESGKVCVPVEYVSGMAEKIQWRDEATGKRLEAPVVKHNVIAGQDIMVVNERVPDEYKVESFVSQFKRGQRCLLTIQSLSVMRGVVMVRGTLQALT